MSRIIGASPGQKGAQKAGAVLPAAAEDDPEPADDVERVAW